MQQGVIDDHGVEGPGPKRLNQFVGARGRRQLCVQTLLLQLAPQSDRIAVAVLEVEDSHERSGPHRRTQCSGSRLWVYAVSVASHGILTSDALPVASPLFE